MANPEHLRILKQGVKEWNEWCKENSGVVPDLCTADLSGAHLVGADLRGADLRRAKLLAADLGRVDLSGVDLSGAKLLDADLSGTKLLEAKLPTANLSGADLSGAHFSRADLFGTILSRTNLGEADLSEARIAYATFSDNDLSTVVGLDSVKHEGPSYISIDTIYKSKGKIPESFLRGAGVPDNFIEYMKSLTGDAIEYYSCFISYSSKDQEFADRLYADLQNKGVRCWFAPEDMMIGDKIRDRLDESIRMRDKLLLILSETSVSSQWVEQEVETALEEERKRGEDGSVPRPVG